MDGGARGEIYGSRAGGVLRSSFHRTRVRGRAWGLVSDASCLLWRAIEYFRSNARKAACSRDAYDVCSVVITVNISMLERRLSGRL